MIQGGVPEPVSPGNPKPEASNPAPSTLTSACSCPVAPSLQAVEARSFPSQPTAEEEGTRRPTMTNGIAAAQSDTVPSGGPSQASHAPASSQPSRQRSSKRTLEQAVQEYLEDQRSNHRRPKTLEWHQQALGLFQHYLLTEHQCALLDQITEEQVRGRFAALPQRPTAIGVHRSSCTVESYARSARAFCQWLVHHRSLQATPFAHLDLPPMQNRVLRPLEPEEWEQLLLACRPPKETGLLAERATARNRAILWMLFETGMRASEVSALRLGDVDREQGILRVQEKGTTARRLTLGHVICWPIWMTTV